MVVKLCCFYIAVSFRTLLARYLPKPALDVSYLEHAFKPPHEMQQQQQQRKNNSGSEGKVQFFEIIFIFYSKGLKIIAIIKYIEFKYLSIDVSKKPIMISN